MEQLQAINANESTVLPLELQIQQAEYQQKFQAHVEQIDTEIKALHEGQGVNNSLSAEDLQLQSWLLERRKGITGSEAASWLGVNPYCTPYKAYLQKMGLEQGFQGNEKTKWGHKLEDVVAEAFVEQTGLKVVPVPMARSTEYPFMLANLDRMVVDALGNPIAILECKTAARNNLSGDRDESGSAIRLWGDGNRYVNGELVYEDDQIPLTYKIQVMHYMIVTGLKKAYVAALISGSDFRVYSINYDEKLASIMIKELDHAFCNYVLDNVAPPKLEADVKTIRPEAKSIKEADQNLLNTCDELKAVKAQIKELQERETTLRDQITSALDDNEELRFGSTLLATYKWRNGRASFDTKQFQLDHPELYKEYLTQGAGYRTLLLK